MENEREERAERRILIGMKVKEMMPEILTQFVRKVKIEIAKEV